MQLGLKEQGYIPGENLRIVWGWAEGDYRKFPTLVSEMLEARVDVIFTAGSSDAARAAKARSNTTPIVSLIGADPISIGLIHTLHAPGGNLIGITTSGNLLSEKQLELLLELVPKAQVVGALHNPSNPSVDLDFQQIGNAAATFGRSILKAFARTPRQIDDAIAQLARDGAQALVAITDAFMSGQVKKIAELCARFSLPSMYSSKEFVNAGGLLSYGANRAETYRQAGIYIGRVLKGERPANLPFLLPSHFELAVNLGTAAKLGIDVPPNFLTRAHEIVD
jgi:putative ABC transport system substrate-binding protein